jgi:hypothetical protein
VSTPESAGEPLFRVVAGTPDDEELAALTAAVLALGGDAESGDRRGPGAVLAAPDMLRLHPLPGPVPAAQRAVARTDRSPGFSAGRGR